MLKKEIIYVIITYIPITHEDAGFNENFQVIWGSPFN